MALIAHPVVDPLILKTATVVIAREGATDTDDFTDHVGELTLTPAGTAVSWVGIGGNTLQDQGVATWSATLGLIQDLDSNGLLRYLLAHEGEKATITATLKDAADVVTIDVTLTPTAIGGSPGAFATGTATLPVDGKPVWS